MAALPKDGDIISSNKAVLLYILQFEYQVLYKKKHLIEPYPAARLNI